MRRSFRNGADAQCPLAAGYARQQAIEMIGSALVEEIWALLHDHKLFDRIRFAALLKQLG